jgi:uncharacterized protein
MLAARRQLSYFHSRQQSIHQVMGSHRESESARLHAPVAVMKPSEALAIYRTPLRQLMNRYGFTDPRVFGSVLTKTDTEDSDLDLLVESVPGTTLFILVGVEEEAQRLTGVRVSVLTAGFLSPKFRDKVLAHAEPL